MKCPKCEAEMEKVTYNSVEVDRCTSCGGLWFDRLEHEDLKEAEGSEAIDTGNPETGMKYNEMENVDCPVCHSPLIPMVDSKQPHIWYEKCSVCGGVFFDAGEFKDYKEETFSDHFKKFFSGPRH